MLTSSYFENYNMVVLMAPGNIRGPRKCGCVKLSQKHRPFDGNKQ